MDEDEKTTVTEAASRILNTFGLSQEDRSAAIATMIKRFGPILMEDITLGTLAIALTAAFNASGMAGGLRGDVPERVLVVAKTARALLVEAIDWIDKMLAANEADKGAEADKARRYDG
jgi:hypothetical protein